MNDDRGDHRRLLRAGLNGTRRDSRAAWSGRAGRGVPGAPAARVTSLLRSPNASLLLFRNRSWMSKHAKNVLIHPRSFVSSPRMAGLCVVPAMGRVPWSGGCG